ncbi:MAG: hypothetical protein M1587_02415 [Thaumarchaeota archaeon]|nr:hypothetical protein [Nitrososphaerota archaeon]
MNTSQKESNKISLALINPELRVDLLLFSGLIDGAFTVLALVLSFSPSFNRSSVILFYIIVFFLCFSLVSETGTYPLQHI